MTLPDLFVIRIGTAKGTASHEMMHERVGSTRPNTAGGGGGKIRVAQFEAQRGARCIEVLSRAGGMGDPGRGGRRESS